jgi:hypothetical protein
VNADQLTSFLTVLVPRVVVLITERKNVSAQEAICILYNSELYETLEQAETKLWRLSSETLYGLLDEELATGSITYPEDQ